MPQTIEQIARDVKAELDSDINLQIVGRWVSQRVTQLYAATKYKALRKLGELPLAAAIGGQNSGGTVTVTQGSNIVTGDATAAPLWSVAQEGQFFRLFNLKTWYRIARVDAATLTLENALVSENSALFSAGLPVPGLSYYIVPRFYAAAADARYFGVFVLDYLYQQIPFMSPERMQEIYPSRFLVGPYPWAVSEFNSNLTGTGQPKLLEFYPAPLIASIVHYTYWAAPPEIGFYDQIPGTLDSYIPRELAMTAVMRYEMARAFRVGQVEAGMAWRNEYRAQETKAREYVDEAIRADSGTDDLTFIMDKMGWQRRPRDYDPVQTAEADVWSRNG